MKKYKVIISFIIVAGMTFSGVVLSGIWKDKAEIKSIELIGNTTLSKNEIFEFAKLSDSLLMSEQLNLQMIEERISKHPNVSSVNAKRVSSRLVIEISEKAPFAIVMPSAKDKPVLLLDDKLNLYNYKKEMRDLSLPVISGLSKDLEISNVPADDYNKMKLAHFIISELMKIDKLLYNFVSEIHFSDSVSVTLYTFEGAVPVYLLDYNSLNPDMQHVSYLQYFNPANDNIRNIISARLITFHNFIKQAMIYRSRESIEFVDLRYKDMVLIKNKQPE